MMVSPSQVWIQFRIGRANAASARAAVSAGRGKPILAQKLAERALRVFRGLGDKLANADRTISGVLLQIADAESDQGKLDRARERLDECLSIRRRLLLLRPEGIPAKDDVSVALERIGDLVFHEVGDPSSASAYHEESLALRRQLVCAEPTNERYVHAVATSEGKLGDILRHQGIFAEAQERLQASLDAHTELSVKNPSSEIYERGMGLALARFGSLQLDQMDLEGARETLENSLYIRQRLATALPSDLNRQLDLGIGLGLLGTVLAMQENTFGARRRLGESLDLLARRCRGAPTSAIVQRFVWIAMWRMAYHFPDGPITWKDLVTFLQTMQQRGTLVPADEHRLEEARSYVDGGHLLQRVDKAMIDIITPVSSAGSWSPEIAL